MMPIRARLPHSSRLSCGRTSGAARSPARAVAASAMGGALGVDPDAVLGQAERDDLVLGELEPPEPHHAVAHHGAGDEVHHADKVGDERGGGSAVDVEGPPDLLDHAVVHHHDAVRHGEASSWSWVTMTVVTPSRRWSCLIS